MYVDRSGNKKMPRYCRDSIQGRGNVYRKHEGIKQCAYQETAEKKENFGVRFSACAQR